jgi:hypothetical protein
VKSRDDPVIFLQKKSSGKAEDFLNERIAKGKFFMPKLQSSPKYYIPFLKKWNVKNPC